MKAHMQTDKPEEVKAEWESFFPYEDSDDMFVRG
jgi:hypothetical protein